jgi:nicotinamidase-related amidase
VDDVTTLGPDTALVVVDVQVGFDEPGWGRRNNEACDDNVAALVDAFGATGRPVVLVRHDSDEPDSPLRAGAPGNALKPFLADLTPDLLATEQVNSSASRCQSTPASASSAWTAPTSRIPPAARCGRTKSSSRRAPCRCRSSRRSPPT